MPGGNAQRPSDVITIFGGKTVEVLNTDAEGRLVMADALARSEQDSPALLIDVATLTGAQLVALGTRIAGVMANDDDVREGVVDAARRAGEQAWPMPLPPELRKGLDSAVADIANVAGDRFGGMLVAGLFLKEFVPDGVRWAHVDIAGPAFHEGEPYGYTPKGGTGAAVRMLVQVAQDVADGTAVTPRRGCAKKGSRREQVNGVLIVTDGGYDIVILGGGSGGYACALRASELGKRVALIEKDKVGGTCLHRGCIPTKALLHAAEIADHARDGAAFGVRSSLDGIDMAGVNAYKDRVVTGNWKGLTGLIKSRGIDIIEDFGKLVSPTAVQVSDRLIEGAHVVLASGSQTRTLPGLEIDGNRVITSDHALQLDHVPSSVVILGGGVIGVEFASVWRSFGAEVTIVEMLPHLVPTEDENSQKLLERAFRRRGINFKVGTKFESVKDSGSRRDCHARGRRDHRRRAAAGRRRPRAGLRGPGLRRGRRGHGPRLRAGR